MQRAASARSQSATRAKTVPVAGSLTSKFEDVACQSPAMKARVSNNVVSLSFINLPTDKSLRRCGRLIDMQFAIGLQYCRRTML
jgi:hypothetical protein